MRVELESAGIRCLDMNYERQRGISRRIRYQWQIARMLRRERAAALHVHHATALILCGIPAWFARIGRVVMSEHGLHQLRERPRYRRSAKWYCRFATDITVVEQTQADYFRDQLRVPAIKIHCVPNGVLIRERLPEVCADMRARLNISTDAFAFFYVGRLNAVKDLGTLLSAFAALPVDVAKNSELYLVGEGPERPELEALCEQLALQQRVHFLGARHDVRDLLMAADAFVMSSTTEGLPMALLEAMASCVPCVATAVGGIPELLAGGRGLTVPSKSPTELAGAMAQLVRSPSLRYGVATNALEWVRRRYSLDSATTTYLRLLGLTATFSAGPENVLGADNVIDT